MRSKSMGRLGRRGLFGAALAVAFLTAAVAPDDPALLDAARSGDAAAVRSLLREGADPNAARGDGMSALHLAAEGGSLEVVRVLIDAGARVEATTSIGGYTPLHVASANAHAPVVEALLDAGADPEVVTTNTGVTPLHLAAKALGRRGRRTGAARARCVARRSRGLTGTNAPDVRSVVRDALRPFVSCWAAARIPPLAPRLSTSSSSWPSTRRRKSARRRRSSRSGRARLMVRTGR